MLNEQKRLHPENRDGHGPAKPPRTSYSGLDTQPANWSAGTDGANEPDWPLAYVDGMNLYQYVRSTPMALTDEMGLLPKGHQGAQPTQPLPPEPPLFVKFLGVVPVVLKVGEKQNLAIRVVETNEDGKQKIDKRGNYLGKTQIGLSFTANQGTAQFYVDWAINAGAAGGQEIKARVTDRDGYAYLHFEGIKPGKGDVTVYVSEHPKLKWNFEVRVINNIVCMPTRPASNPTTKPG